MRSDFKFRFQEERVGQLVVGRMRGRSLRHNRLAMTCLFRSFWCITVMAIYGETVYRVCQFKDIYAVVPEQQNLRSSTLRPACLLEASDGHGRARPRRLPASAAGHAHRVPGRHHHVAHRDSDRRDPGLHRRLLRREDGRLHRLAVFHVRVDPRPAVHPRHRDGRGEGVARRLPRDRADDVGRAVPADPRRGDQAQVAAVRHGGARARARQLPGSCSSTSCRTCSTS